jgi:hypothetical protein
LCGCRQRSRRSDPSRQSGLKISESDRFSRVFLAKKLARFSIDQMYLGASFARHCFVLGVRDIVFFIIVQRVLNV